MGNTEFKDGTWIEELIEEVGGPLTIDPYTGKICTLNPPFVARYFSHELQLRYCVKRNAFILYDEERGIWEYISDHKVTETLWIATRHCLKESGHADAYAKFITKSLIATVKDLLKSIVEHDSSKVIGDKQYFHAYNSMIVFNANDSSWESLLVDPEFGDHTQAAEPTTMWRQMPFDPEFYSHDRSDIVFDSGAICPRFLNELLRPAMTEEDLAVLQLYLGQILLGTNISQTFMLLEGTPGGGKSTAVNIIEKVIGKHHCGELRAGHTTGRFEIGSYIGKKLLTGKDVSSEYMNNAGGRSLKFLTGNDMVTGEHKGVNKRFNFEGNFNIIITSNNTIRMKFDGDLEAWRRRILIIKYDCPPPKKKIANFDDVLLKEEGPGILNWIMDGAIKLIKGGGIIKKSSHQKAAVDNLLRSSDPVEYFADNFIQSCIGGAITTATFVEYFTKFCHTKNWDVPADRAIQQRLKSYMAEKHGACQSRTIKLDGKAKRGYNNFQISRGGSCEK